VTADGTGGPLNDAQHAEELTVRMTVGPRHSRSGA
jgi:hypothetical protein